MIRLKTKKEIEILAQGGKILSGILAKLAKAAAPGVFTDDLEKMTRNLIKEAGGEPAFLGYETGGGKYPAALCVSVNDAVVHTPATFKYKIQEGDLVSLDLGMRYQGFCTDAATTVIAKNEKNVLSKSITTVRDFDGNKKEKKLVEATKKALQAAIRECRAGQLLSAIGKAVEKSLGGKFGIVRDLVGHGVGHGVHEEPMVPNYYDRAFDKIKMEEGLVIAIEPMITTGSGAIEMAEDGFTYRTADGKPAAHFEATVAVTKKGPRVLTPLV